MACARCELAGLEPTETSRGIVVGGELALPYSEKGAVSIDALIERFAPEAVSTVAQERLQALLGSQVAIRAGKGSANISLDGAPLAKLTATRATLAYREGGLKADFLTVGAHWNTLADELQAVIAERERRRAAAAQVNQATSALPKAQTAAPGSYLIEAAPSDLGTALVERCLVASEAIRVRRNAAYSHPASLTSRRSRVTFYPVAEQAGSRFVVPIPLAPSRRGGRQRVLTTKVDNRPTPDPGHRTNAPRA